MYLNSANYSQNGKYANGIQKLIETLDKLANKSSDYSYINHQRKVYGNVPL